MLATTRKKPLKKISELSFDLEIVNPIESKSLFGGCQYHPGCYYDCSYYENSGGGGSLLNTVVVTNNNYYGNSFGYSSNHILNGGYHSDWDKANWGNDYNNNNNDPWVDPYANYDSNNDGILDADDLDNNGIKDECTLSNLPLKVEQQIGNLCVYNALTYAANLLGSNITTVQMMQNVAVGVSTNPNSQGNSNFANLLVNGLNAQQTVIAINQVFYATPVTNSNQIEAAICAQQTVIAFYNNHEVVIVGYNSNNQAYTVADSQWSQNNGYHTIGYQSVTLDAFILTGVKP